MDKEQKVAYEIIRQRIVNEIDRLESLDKPGSSLKRWRRFGAAFSWDPTVYPEILEKPTVSDKELMSLLRNTETKFMKKWGVIDKIPLHHIIANRTGGDLGLRLPVDTWEEVKKRVFDATGAQPGNGAANLNAASQFDERSHLGRAGAKGSIFDPALGYGDPADPTRSPILHGPGTKDFGTKLGKDPVILRSSPVEIAKALTPEIVKQQEIFETVSKDPIVQQQRNVLTQAGYPEAFKADTPIERIQEISKEIKGTDIPKRFALSFNFKGGKAVLSTLPIPVAGALFDVKDVQAALTTPRTDDMAQAERDVSGLSGLTGLAALSPPLTPVLAPMSIGFAGAAAGINYRRKRDEELERTRQIMDPEYKISIPENAVITRTKPRLPTSFTGRL